MQENGNKKSFCHLPRTTTITTIKWCSKITNRNYNFFFLPMFFFAITICCFSFVFHRKTKMSKKNDNFSKQ